MSSVEFHDVKKSYGHRQVLGGIRLVIEPNTFAVIFGPPGCGKSVILRLLTGLERPDSGQVFLRGEDMTRASPAERNVGYVPQSFALYPHYRVYDNIAYPLNLSGAPQKESDAVVHRVAEMLGIGPLLQKKPNQLSGGEKQRVALARGIAKRTDIYVLDDPLAGLDFKLREQLFDDLRRLQASLQATFVYTTSDPLEALMLAQQLVVLDQGQVIESGGLESVYAEPKRLRTMALLGFPSTNLIPGTLSTRGKQVWCQTPLLEFPVQLRYASVGTENQPVTVAIRPQNLILNPETLDGTCNVNAQVVLKEDLGGELVVDLDAGGTPLRALVRQDDVHRLGEGPVRVGIAPASMIVYTSGDGLRVGQGAA